jgi:lipoate-protein ligase A
VAAAAEWVGEWWSAALGRFGMAEGDDLVVHRGRAEPGRHGALVCFSGRGPGELLRDGRKVMGVSQWRSREGALFHTCAYTRWDPGPLVDLFDLAPVVRRALRSDLAAAALGFEDLGPGLRGVASLRDALLESFPTWGGH